METLKTKKKKKPQKGKRKNDKKLSLYPLDFEEAIKDILSIPPEKK